MEKTIKIPEGYEARIEGNKIILEPKESEGEKIRKGLIDYFNDFSLPTFGGLDPKKILAWLEKQGSQNLDNSYCKKNCKGFQETGRCFADGECRAKREAEQKPIIIPKFREGDIIRIKTSDAKYKITEISDGYYRGKGWCLDIVEADKSDAYELVKQGSAWSEEDINRFRNLIYLVERSDEGKGTKEGFVKFINRLKSLKERYTWKPSDEQLEYLSAAIEESNENPVLESLYNDLEKLKEKSYGSTREDLSSPRP
jgi:hypothetical protein